ncbi:MAG: di-trans,poly-cis-decaprenylcistransferase [Oscillospiraceae bacterium]|nr:di-trans,poly-cis-decaprenylcistransferase [Oscillospiraceae bacterium]
MADKKATVRHIGIIMDGNGRWAKQHQLPRAAGHARGAEVFRTITRHCEKLGIEALTVYAFSTENWSRSAEEVDAIMDLLRRYLKDAFGFKGESIRVRFIGRRDRLAADLLENMQKIEQSSAQNTGLTLNVALDYGGRDEIVHAARALAERAAAGELRAEEIDEAVFEQNTFTAGCPPVDFILRPSGEQRISNFLLWQCAYSEFIYMDTLWPDFTPQLLDEAIAQFEGRNRRFGGR